MSASRKLQPPRGLARRLYRLPIWLYRLRLGWLLNNRFLLLHHTGRRTALPRQTVLEVVDHDPEHDIYVVAAGFGPQSDWYRNLRRHSKARIEVGRRRLAVTAVHLTAEQSGRAMADYARRHPLAARLLLRFIGLQVDDWSGNYAKIGAIVPFVALHAPRPTTSPSPVEKADTSPANRR